MKVMFSLKVSVRRSVNRHTGMQCSEAHMCVSQHSAVCMRERAPHHHALSFSNRLTHTYILVHHSVRVCVCVGEGCILSTPPSSVGRLLGYRAS